MKKLILLFSLIIVAGCIQAQTTPVGMPPYRILTTDSVYVTPANLKHHKTMLVYFAPDCPHCQHLTVELKEKMKQLGDTQIIMITWSANYDIRAIKNFVRDYDLKKYPNIIVGTEGYTSLVMKYFNVQTTPYVAVYNSDKKLIKGYSKSPDIDSLIAVVKSADKKKT
ncbi:thioredoxin fold domain-containing protein [Mucilaginibacter sp.]|uniref:TlpA family protein disulfide reductase n=1 Tax=Mucilaginibacter sp. TaxID=1882438 RepID=UPI00262E75DC|nr:thioredoxin fold domain-containing protein [Mucilaginibacter sp.]MDB4924858.1 thiol-disulfide oxidoreductase [Mucilaginibacter sp.]